MLYWVKESMFYPWRKLSFKLCDNDGYETVSGIDDDEFGALETGTYGIKSGFRKKTSSIRNVLLIGAVFIVTVVVSVFVVKGLSKTGKSDSKVLNSALSPAEADDGNVELSKLIQLPKEEMHETGSEDGALTIDTENYALKRTVLKVSTGNGEIAAQQQLENDEATETKRLEKLQNKENEEPSYTMVDSIKALQTRLEQQLKQKDLLLSEQIKKLEDKLEDFKA